MVRDILTKKEVSLKQMQQEAWKKARAVQPSLKELKEVITAKKAELLQRQEHYREAVLLRIDKQVSLQNLRERIDKYSKLVKESGQNDSDIVFEYGHHTFPLDRWKTQYNLELFYLSKALKNEQYFLQALKTDRLKDEQILDILDGKYFKDVAK